VKNWPLKNEPSVILNFLLVRRPLKQVQGRLQLKENYLQIVISTLQSTLNCIIEPKEERNLFKSKRRCCYGTKGKQFTDERLSED
jgi:hypothetical protein